MHIGIDASRANRKEKTGIEWYAYHLLSAMKKLTDVSHQFLLYTDKKLCDDLAILPKGWKEKLLGWPPRKFWTQGRLSLEMLFRAPDLLFIPSHVIPVLHPKRVVLTCHDIGFERRPELYPKGERAYHRWSMHFGVRAATHIIAVSEFTKQELIECYRLPEEKITVIHHGFFGGVGSRRDTPLVSQGRGIQQPSLHWSKSLTTFGMKLDPSLESRGEHPRKGTNLPYLLYVGRIEAKKNLLVIIDAFAELKRTKKIPEEMRLLLVGRRGYQSEMMLKAAEEKGRGAIRYLPWVSSEKLQELYRNATAFLFPSLYEGFGFPLLEALSYNIPVIAANIPALREIGSRFVLYAEPTSDGFAEAIVITMNNGVNRADSDERSAWLLQFSWEKTAQKTLTVLTNALQ